MDILRFLPNELMTFNASETMIQKSKHQNSLTIILRTIKHNTELDT